MSATDNRDYFAFNTLGRLTFTSEEICALLGTYYRIMNKVGSTSFKRERFFYLLIEELSLLLDVLVIRIEKNPKLEYEGNILGSNFQALGVNIKSEDYGILNSLFNTDELKSQCLNLNRIISQRNKNPVGRGNNSIKHIDSVVIIPFRDKPLGNPLGTVEIYYSSNKKDVPARYDIANLFLQKMADESNEIEAGICLILSTALEYALERVIREDREDDFSVYPTVRESKLEFLNKHAFNTPRVSAEEFVNEYREHFKPLDKVFGNLIDKFGFESGLYFTYRLPKDDHCSYFLSAKQAEAFLQKNNILEEAIHLMTYPYRDNLLGGLNGYLLSTAYPLYVPAMHNDERWVGLSENELIWEQDRIKYNSKSQAGLLRKLFSDIKKEPLNTYIVPILVYYHSNASKPEVLVALHYTSNGEIPNEMRKRMFDVAWESYSTLELCLVAQQTTEQTMRMEMEKRKTDELESFSLLLGHTVPKFIFKPIEYYSERIIADILNPPRRIRDFEMLRFYNTKGQMELKWYLDYYLGGSSSGDPIARTCNLQYVVEDIRKIFSDMKEFFISGHIDQHDAILMGSQSVRVRDLADKRIELTADISEKFDVMVLGSREAHLIALWNLIDNGLNSFNLSELCTEPGRTLKINLSAGEQNGFFKLSISNNGRQIAPYVEKRLRALFLMARSGEESIEIEGERLKHDQIISQMRIKQEKEKQCQGLYRTARFLHDLSPRQPGYIQMPINSQVTTFELLILKAQ